MKTTVLLSVQIIAVIFVANRVTGPAGACQGKITTVDKRLWRDLLSFAHFASGAHLGNTTHNCHGRRTSSTRFR